MANVDIMNDGRHGYPASVVAHELQGPVTVMLGCVSMLRDQSLPDEARDTALDMIEGQARAIAPLVQSLLASFDTGRHRGRFDVCQMVEEVVTSIRPQAQLDGATIEPLGLDRAPLPVEAVPGHVRCILSNLLRNGLAYSLQPARVFVEIRGDRDDRRPVEIAVHDHGLGIPNAVRERIFEPGYRLSDSVPGSGLGLAISRELAEQNGGGLWLERSEPLKGSVFVLSLPRTGARRRQDGRLTRPVDRQIRRSARRSAAGSV
jgi:signal transduction histidine kinase